MQRQRIAALTQLGDNIFTSKSENNNIYNIQPQANGRSCFTRLPRQRRAQLQRLHRQGWISFLHTCKSTFVSIWNSFLFSAAVQWREASRHRGCGGQTRTSAEPVCWQWVFLFVNCLLQNYLIDLQNLNKLCGRWRKTPWPKSPGTPLTSGIRFFFLLTADLVDEMAPFKLLSQDYLQKMEATKKAVGMVKGKTVFKAKEGTPKVGLTSGWN